MPTGKTLAGVDASGAIVLIYKTGPLTEYITGEETSYVADSKIFVNFESVEDVDIFSAFEAPGSIDSFKQLTAARRKFIQSCVELEQTFADYDIGRVTFGNLKNSSKPGKMSAKPRYVERARRGKFGFPKGSFELTDKSIEATALREVWEETNLTLDPSRLVDTKKQVNTGGQSHYAIFHYELKDDEYRRMVAHLRIKNIGHENELHHLAFRTIPANRDKFFTNMASRKAYNTTAKGRGGSRRKTRRANRG